MHRKYHFYVQPDRQMLGPLSMPWAFRSMALALVALVLSFAHILPGWRDAREGQQRVAQQMQAADASIVRVRLPDGSCPTSSTTMTPSDPDAADAVACEGLPAMP